MQVTEASKVDLVAEPVSGTEPLLVAVGPVAAAMAKVPEAAVAARSIQERTPQIVPGPIPAKAMLLLQESVPKYEFMNPRNLLFLAANPFKI